MPEATEHGLKVLLDTIESQARDKPDALTTLAYKHLSDGGVPLVVVGARREGDRWREGERSVASISFPAADEGAPAALIVLATGDLSPTDLKGADATTLDETLAQVRVVVLGYPETTLWMRKALSVADRLKPWLERARTGARPGAMLVWADDAGIHTATI